MAKYNVNLKAPTVIGASTNIPYDEHRTYLFVVVSADTTVTISGGTPFTIPSGGHWNPTPAPQNAIAFSGTGTLVEG